MSRETDRPHRALEKAFAAGFVAAGPCDPFEAERKAKLYAAALAAPPQEGEGTDDKRWCDCGDELRLDDETECWICRSMEDERQPPLPDPATFGACYDCGRHYGDEYGFPDLVLPNDVWAQISPRGDEGGLLCPSCICRRAYALGMSGVPAMWASGPLKSEPYTPGPLAAADAPHRSMHTLLALAYDYVNGEFSCPELAEEIADALAADQPPAA
jgi:hypothetical protein